MPEYIVPPVVEDDLEEIRAFIARDNPEAALRVVDAAYETFRALAHNPGLGHPRTLRRPAHQNLRTKTVSGYSSYLIIYRETSRGIEVIRVLHGARNINALLRKQ